MIYKVIEVILISLSILLVTYSAMGQTNAFPGAAGYGRFASGGRGDNSFLDAQVVEVTNLEDYGNDEEPIVGSFRWALAQQDTLYNGTVNLKKPTTIIFRVGGVIQLKQDIHTSTKNLTIAGQTALGDGICFRDYTVNLSGSENVIVRYLRFRPGDETGEEVSCFRIENGGNFIIDHCSFSWAIEENTHFSSDENITVQWCILSESLCNSIHKKGERGFAAQWGGEFASYHHNLLAHHRSRMPRVNGMNVNDTYVLVDYRNNVNYNWGSAGAMYGGEFMSKSDCRGYCHVNVVNNYYLPGPAAEGNLFAAPLTGDNSCGYPKWYVNGNIMFGDEAMTNDNWLGISSSKKDNIKSSVEHVQLDGTLEAYLNYTQSASDTYISVLDDAGATLPQRDAHDERVVAEVKGEREIIRYIYITPEGLSTPVQGVSSGIIDTQENLVSPEERTAGKDAWSIYGSTLPDQAPIDNDHDGMPDEWEIAHDLDPNNYSDFSIITPSGYTYLEVYLAELTGEIIDYNTPQVSIAEKVLDANNITFYPNPVNQQLNVESQQSIHTITIYGLNGDVRLKKTINECSCNLNLSAFTPGLYFIEILTNEGYLFSTKILKN